MNDRHFYHFATQGLKDDYLFSSAVDFIAGINRIALCICRLGMDIPVQVICFCLMDNHLHFILYGTQEACQLFMENYKQATELWLRHHGGDNRPGKEWRIDFWLIRDRDRLKTTISYIHRNPLAAGMAVSPAGYRWSSASLMYSDLSWVPLYGKRADSFSLNERRRLFSSKTDVPGDWIILPDGLIWPGQFIAYKTMERQFDSVRDYQFVLNRKVEEEINTEMYGSFVSLPDGEIASRAQRIVNHLYGNQQILELDVRQRISLARQLKKETGATIKQIARIVHLKLSELEAVLNPRIG